MTLVQADSGRYEVSRLVVFWRRFRRNKAAVLGLTLFTAVLLMAVFADVIAPGDPLKRAGMPLLHPFSNWSVPLGTDQLGRSIFAQLVHGSRISLVIGVLATFVAVVCGVIIGSLAGYFGGILDDILMRITDAFQTIPEFIFLLTLVAVLGSSLEWIILSIGIVAWPSVARLTRAQVMSLRNREFVDAARNLGASDHAIIWKEILPNALPPVIVYASILMALAILLESALAFLNLGDKNFASWGNMIGQGRSVLYSAPSNILIPGIAILLTVLSFSLVGEGLNDAMNPRQKP